MNAPRSLAQALLRKVMIGYLIFAAGSAGLRLFLEYQDTRQDIGRSLDSLARTFAPGVASALWDYQEDLLKSMARGIGEHPLVTTVAISDLRGRINVAWRASDDETPSSDLTVRQTLYHRFEDGQQEALGTLSIASSESRVFAHLRKILWSISLSILTLLLFLGGMLTVLSWMLVVKPLTRFSEQVSRLTVEDYGQQIDLGQVEIAEIATLQQGFNHLLRKVAESHALITTANTELEQRVAERTRNLDQRNQELVREHELTLALVHSIPGFVCIVDSAGRILLANQAASALIGRSGSALSGQSWLTLSALAPADHPLRDLFYQAHEVGNATVETTFINSAGQERAYQFEALRVGSGAEARIIIDGLDITEQHAQKLRLQHLAFHDDLTGLPNRGLLLNRIEHTIRTATRENSSFALLFIDLDEFKPINDTAGHEAGDAVLREIASRLRRCVRESDTVARLGGDEFVLLLPDYRCQDPQQVAEAVLDAVAQPIAWQDATFKISASIGFALFPRDGKTIEHLLGAADAAMYRAKLAGRNRVDLGVPLAEARQADGSTGANT